MAKVRVKKPNKFVWFLLVILIIILVLNGKGILRKIFPLSHEDIVELCCQEYDLDFNLVMGVIKAESNFDEDALSNKGAKGLMQFTDETALWVASKMEMKDFEIKDLDNPKINIKMGCYYLDYLLNKYNNDEKTALAAYNAGPGRVDGWLSDSRYSVDGKKLDVIVFNETSDYVNKVLTYKTIFRNIYLGGKDPDE